MSIDPPGPPARAVGGQRAMAKEMRLAIAATPAAKWSDTIELAREAEREGFDAIAMWDHMNFPGVDCPTGLTAIACATSKIKVWANVMAAGYRPPSIVAKSMASLDYISGGRVILGMGSGWDEKEFRAYGFPFVSLAERRAQLAETVQIINEMWTKERATFRGKHFSIEDSVCEPKPVQKPRPPIWIGTYGG